MKKIKLILLSMFVLLLANSLFAADIGKAIEISKEEFFSEKFKPKKNSYYKIADIKISLDKKRSDRFNNYFLLEDHLDVYLKVTRENENLLKQASEFDSLNHYTVYIQAEKWSSGNLDIKNIIIEKIPTQEEIDKAKEEMEKAKEEAAKALKEEADRQSQSYYQDYMAGKIQANPNTDFNYTITADGKGVRITRYIGVTNPVIFPDEIEGLPVNEISLYPVAWEGDVTIILPKDLKVCSLEHKGYGSHCIHILNLPKGILNFSVRAKDHETYKFHADLDLPLCEKFKAEYAIFQNSDFILPKIQELVLLYTNFENNEKMTIPAVWNGKDIKLYSTNIKELVFEEGIKVIGKEILWSSEYSFYAYNKLEKITFPSTLVEIKDSAFRNT